MDGYHRRRLRYPAPGRYGPPPPYGAYPSQAGAPPGMVPPPGMGVMPAPGITPPPGIVQTQSPLPARPGAIPPNFAPPAGMPNINFTAPVIRLGTTGPGKPDGRSDSKPDPMSGGGRRAGIGMGDSYRSGDSLRNQVRDTLLAMQPPTREEIARTIFIGRITDGVGGDEGLERLLRTAGSLRRWTRATDADGKPCAFGFAEYEDAESLETAAEIFKDVMVPVKKQEPNKTAEDNEEVEKTKLLVVVDEASMKYAEEWKSRRDEDPSASQFRIDTAKEALESVLKSFERPVHKDQVDAEGDTAMESAETKIDTATGEVVTIPLTIEDELADIPAEMRETVAAEIAAFRDRSTRRDMERLAREEEMEKAERQRGSGGRVNRLASPAPTSASFGGGANGIPLGPSKRGIEGAPSGPKAFQGAQIPRDYQGGVAFVNGGALNGASSVYIKPEEEDDSASDEELERRRKDKKKAELEKQYLDYERKWLNREKSRTAALLREQARDKDEDAKFEKEKEDVAKRLAEWDDDAEAARKSEEYYQDRSLWVRNRAAFRAREIAADERDRADEERELARENQKREAGRAAADDFLARSAEEIDERAARTSEPREPQRFKMSLGAAASQKARAVAPRRTAAEVEGLLEDEEDTGEQQTQRKLVPIQFDSAAEARGLSEEERQQAARQLAQDIPTSKEGLWGWNIQWDFLDDSVITEQLRPFVEKKIVEYLGVQEQMLVELIEGYVRERKTPEALVTELEEALDEEAEALVKKLWRMIIFFSESEKRGLSG
ncbi:hypothetical protein K490DRAFT_32516 [Saccharata proteae CBS 121410]|uniref:PWI domain-containing protein n=1 Tax=Saccharata proteae CBS 121410 TaxID=1314787 RepID=A0A9P4I226_9PEZI|nr:hypothetical protein K490DRAFT_32516 [Saccharata proteae CBS 121410]